MISVTVTDCANPSQPFDLLPLIYTYTRSRRLPPPGDVGVFVVDSAGGLSAGAMAEIVRIVPRHPRSATTRAAEQLLAWAHAHNNASLSTRASYKVGRTAAAQYAARGAAAAPSSSACCAVVARYRGVGCDNGADADITSSEDEVGAAASAGELRTILPLHLYLRILLLTVDSLPTMHL